MTRQVHPDVLIIVTDQHRYDCLGITGNRQVHTPALDRLAREGVLVEQAFCPFPLCAPSRASFLTGLYAYQHAVWDNQGTLSPGIPTFPAAFRDAGYDTIAVGKMHLTPTYADVGFRRMILAEQDGPGRHDDDYHRYLRERDLCDENDLMDQVDEFRRAAPREYYEACGAIVSNLSEEHHSTTWIGDRAVDEVTRWRQEERPQLLYASFIKPHHPFDPPRRWAEMYDPQDMEILPGWLPELREVEAARGPGYFPNAELREAQIRSVTAYYYATISQIDHQIERILEALQGTGRYDNTIVLFTSDHGEFLGFHHLLLKHNYLYEPLVRVPMIWKVPGWSPVGREKTGAESNLWNPVSLVDVAPTLCDLAGVLWEGGAGCRNFFTAPRREYICAESTDEYMIRSERYKLLYLESPAARQLFDLEADPLELDNRYEDPTFSEIRAELEAELLRTFLFVNRPPVHRDRSAPVIAGDNVQDSRLDGGALRYESERYFREKMRKKRTYECP